jgi:hemerythrin-like metal-binding protein
MPVKFLGSCPSWNSVPVQAVKFILHASSRFPANGKRSRNVGRRLLLCHGWHFRGHGGRLLFQDGCWLQGFGFRRLLFQERRLFIQLTTHKLFQMLAEFLVRKLPWEALPVRLGWSTARESKAEFGCVENFDIPGKSESRCHLNRFGHPKLVYDQSMAQFTWSAENEVFLAPVDAEHRDLFRIADGLEDAVARNAFPDEVCEHLQRLTVHVAEHFSHEEELMRGVRYPSYGWHRAQHNTARRRLKVLVPLIEAGSQEAANLLLEFLAGWLQDHTTLTDKMMAAFVRNYERTHGGSLHERMEKWSPVPLSHAASPAPMDSPAQTHGPRPASREQRN